MTTRFDGHTPGKWYAFKGAGWCVGRKDAQERRDRHQPAIAIGMTPSTTLVAAPNWFDDTEARANAELMAAAPSLLALALELRRGLEFARKHARIDCAMMSDGEAMGWGTVDNLLARASALLDKEPTR